MRFASTLVAFANLVMGQCYEQVSPVTIGPHVDLAGRLSRAQRETLEERLLRKIPMLHYEN